MKKQLTSVVLTSVMVAGNVVGSFALEDSGSSKTKTELDKVRSEKSALISENKNIKKEIDKSEQKINDVKADLKSIFEEKVKNEKELNNTKKDLEIEYAALKDQMANYYMNSYLSNMSVLKELITSDSASDFIVKSSHLKYIVDDRDKKVDKVSSLLNKQKELSKKISEDENKLVELNNRLLKEQDELKAVSEDNYKRISKLKSKEMQLEDILEVQQEEEARIQAAILSATKQEDKVVESNTSTSNDDNKYTDVSTSSPTISNSHELQKPVVSYRITSKFGWRTHPVTGGKKFHYGIDLAAGKGTPIMASQSGEVVISQYSSSYGNYIVVNHGDGIATLYAHLDERLASVGDKVKVGQVIGKMGSTGMSTGPHLHFEVRVNGEKVDPMTRVNL